MSLKMQIPPSCSFASLRVTVPHLMTSPHTAQWLQDCPDSETSWWHAGMENPARGQSPAVREWLLFFLSYSNWFQDVVCLPLDCQSGSSRQCFLIYLGSLWFSWHPFYILLCKSSGNVSKQAAILCLFIYVETLIEWLNLFYECMKSKILKTKWFMNIELRWCNFTLNPSINVHSMCYPQACTVETEELYKMHRHKVNDAVYEVQKILVSRWSKPAKMELPDTMLTCHLLYRMKKKNRRGKLQRGWSRLTSLRRQVGNSIVFFFKWNLHFVLGWHEENNDLQISEYWMH